MFMFLDTFEGIWDWLCLLTIGLLIGVGVISHFGVYSEIIALILGITLVLAGVFGLINSWLIPELMWKMIGSVVFLIITIIGANLVYQLPVVGPFLTPFQSVYTVKGFAFYGLLGIVIAILIFDIFKSESM